MFGIHSRVRPSYRVALLAGVLLLVLAAACADAGDGAADDELSDPAAADDDGDDAAADEADDADADVSDDDAADDDDAAEADAAAEEPASESDDEGLRTALARSEDDDAGTDERADVDEGDDAHEEPRSGEHIIREGTMTVDVPEEGYQQAYQQLTQRVADLGGSVVSSQSETTDEGATSGTVTVRVPVEQYDDLLESTGDLGEVQTADITSEDVSAEYVDLESRLRHERAQEEFYMELLERAEGVSDAIEVQQNLEGVQERIEQLQGRLNVLDDRTSYSTLTVDLVEPETAQLLASDDEQPGLAAYFDQAQRGFVTVIGWGIVAGGSLAPILVPLLIAGLAWRLFRRPAAPAIASKPPGASNA